MVANTGVVLALPDVGSATPGVGWWPPIGQPILGSDLPSEGSQSPEVEAELRPLRDAVYGGEPVVVVSGEVAQMMAVGRRELDRRARRRAAAKQARKINRTRHA